MAWQDRFLRHFGPGWVSGITFGDWIKLLAQNRFRINVRYLGRAASITGLSVANSALRLFEATTQGHRIRRQPVVAPLFIIGHWRSGTTHLHNLLCIDDRFTGPTLYDVSFPHWFLGVKLHWLMDFFAPETRWLDNVVVSSKTPEEDEYALAQLTRLSPTIAFMFPRTGKHYQRFLSFRQASDAERQRWRKAFIWLVKKLHAANPRLLVLKSPQHTARIRLILKVFPEARFIHIRRDPWRVFQSCRKVPDVLADYNCLQLLPDEDVDEVLIGQYKEMYDCFLEDRHLIPAGHFHETSYEQLVQHPLQEVRAIYQALNLPDFEHVRTRLEAYLGETAGYRTNRHLDISPDVQRRIVAQWGRFFDEWGYSQHPNTDAGAAAASPQTVPADV